MARDQAGGAAPSEGGGSSRVQFWPAEPGSVRVRLASEKSTLETVLTAMVAAWEALPEAARLAQMLPTPALLTRIQALDLDEVDDATLVEVAAAARRVQAAAQETLTRAAAILAERATMNQPGLALVTDGEASTAGEELSIRLTAPRNECLSLVRQGIMLTTVLAKTGIELRLGRIDAAKAKAMVEALHEVPWQAAMAVEDLVLPKAPGRTPQQLRRDVAKALISVDPEGAHERAQLRARGRKVTRPRALPDGAASMWIEGPAPDVLALDIALDAAARAAKAEGDDRTLDQLRFDTLAGVGSHALATGEFPDGTSLAATVGGRRPEIHVIVAIEHLLPPDALADRDTVTVAGQNSAPDRPPAAARGAIPDSPPAAAGGAVPDSPPAAATEAGTHATPGAAAPTTGAPPTGAPTRHRCRDPLCPNSAMPRQPGGTPVPPVDPHADHPDPPTRSIDPESVPILAGYGPITPATARAIAAGGIWRRLVTDPLSDTVLDLGHTRYRPTQALADHIVARDRTCVRPCCSRPAGGCQLDHNVPWVEAPEGSEEPGDPSGGRTSHDNLSPLCGRDHNVKTHGAFEVEQTEPGVFEWTTPAGLRYRRERDETTTFLGHIINDTLHPPQPPDAPPPF
ncbi:HNH endonuclease signature motif containing protein [Occultella gossypii]|uniref:DUF222 domain-containing protein n=1 Tax=Occultella gossypii TaxID=2800820 RepID=A0ABS7S8E5_9MICO|nr:HNH endonuclease signature motif containing protein [Occultella gossypii]MBZ2196622.1 DUF222 domain-containing protein [Occultella gossypii]